VLASLLAVTMSLSQVIACLSGVQANFQPGQSDGLVAMAGYDTHFGAYAPYTNVSAVKTDLNASGVRHVRDGSPGTLASGIGYGAALGVDKNNEAYQSGNGNFSETQATVDSKISAPGVDYIELCGNEQDNDTNIQGTWQQMLATCVTTEMGWINSYYPNGVPVPVIGPSLVDMVDDTPMLASAYTQYNTTKPPYANFHPGTGPYQPSYGGIETFAMQNAASISTTGKYFVTEFGWSDRKNTTLTETTCGSNPCKKPTGYIYNRTNGINESAIVAYDLRALLTWYNNGATRMYFYQFADVPTDCSFGAQGFVTANLTPTPPLGYQNDDCSGSYSFSGTVTLKPEYTAVKNYLSLFADPGASFTPPMIPLTVLTSSGNVDETVVANRAGTVFVILWREEEDYYWEGAEYCSIGSPPSDGTSYPSDNYSQNCTATSENATVSMPGYNLNRIDQFNADGSMTQTTTGLSGTVNFPNGNSGYPVVLEYHT
jgi:hypothetical protein